MAKKRKAADDSQGWTLPPGHGWKASPGYNVFVIDRGLAQLEIPQGWVVQPTDDCVRIYDREPPDDDCAFGLSVLDLPPEWRSHSLAGMVEAAGQNDERKVLGRSPVVEGDRPGIEWAWTEVRFEDAAARRPAVSRLAIARSEPILLLLTFDFWESERAERAAVWDHVLESLVLGQTFDDPLYGPRLA